MKFIFMKVVEGEYENGVVRLLEEVPDVKSKKVLITFFDEEEIEEKLLGLRIITTT